jgi:hypothetical protein
MLNYLYAILESEARIAAVAVGLDPNLGMLHVDTDTRPSLACDLMEAVRTDVDAYVLNWITCYTLRREWFFEEGDGNCRLMAECAARLAEAAPGLASAVVPIAESVAKALLRGGRRETGRATSPIRRRPDSFLGKPSSNRELPAIPRVCGRCGGVLKTGRELCRTCADLERDPTSLPNWLTIETFRHRVVPALQGLSAVDIARCLSCAESYAAQIRTGERMPHQRHRQALSLLVRLSGQTR